MQEIVLTASNIKCGGCAENIRAGLEPLSGVVQVSVDVSSGQVEVKGEGLERGAVAQKLADLGYPEQR